MVGVEHRPAKISTSGVDARASRDANVVTLSYDDRPLRFIIIIITLATIVMIRSLSENWLSLIISLQFTNHLSRIPHLKETCHQVSNQTEILTFPTYLFCAVVL